MKKKMVRVFGKEHYLLGNGHDGIYYYLQKENWDCGWYWGLGYVESFTNNSNPTASRDIASHSHFDYMFFHEKNGYDNFKEFFQETPLSDKEIWTLCELMKSAYTLRNMADLTYRGGAHYTTNPCQGCLHDVEMNQKINDIMIPAVMAEVRNLLIGEVDA